jgi:hypothetical protein
MFPVTSCENAATVPKSAQTNTADASLFIELPERSVIQGSYVSIRIQSLPSHG